MGEGEGQGVVGGERDGAGLYMWGLELLFRGGKRIAREIFGVFYFYFFSIYLKYMS